MRRPTIWFWGRHDAHGEVIETLKMVEYDPDLENLKRVAIRWLHSPTDSTSADSHLVRAVEKLEKQRKVKP